MAQKKSTKPSVIPLLKTSIDILLGNKLILLPFCIIAFVQLLILEILYFVPRYPLSVFFAPIIRRVWSERFLHYPFNFILLPKLFQYTQTATYLFLSSFLIGVAIYIIFLINNEKKVSFRIAFQETVSSYIHIFLGALFSLLTYYGLASLYGLVIGRAFKIRSETGIFYIIKRVVTDSAPYGHLLIGILVTTVFAFVIPIIVIEKRKFFSAITINFKNLWRSFWYIFALAFIPTLLYVPVLLLRNNISNLEDTVVPGIRVLVLILNIFIVIAIDATVYTAITTYYLLQKENK